MSEKSDDGVALQLTNKGVFCAQLTAILSEYGNPDFTYAGGRFHLAEFIADQLANERVDIPESGTWFDVAGET